MLYASFGSGHKRAAQALVEAFQEKQIRVDCRDLLEFMPAAMSKFYSSAYDYMITSSRGLWKLTYNLVNAPKAPYRPARAITQKWQFTRLKDFLLRSPFTHVVSTHFTPSALLTDWREMGDLYCKAFSVITDHETHRCWKRAKLDHYFVASEHVSSEMREFGVPAGDVTVSGIPVSKAFSTSISREEARTVLNLPQEGNIVMVLCSAVTVKKSLEMLQELATLQEIVRFLVVVGADTAKENAIKKALPKDNRFVVFGFTKQIPELMRASEVILTKPGGLIVSEALSIGVPQILLEPIPGQEEANARFAVEHGAATCVTHKRSIYASTVRKVLENTETLQKMRDASRNAGRPQAASAIVETILSRFII